MNLDQFNKRINAIIRRYARNANREEQEDLRQECLLMLVSRADEVRQLLEGDRDAAARKIYSMLKRRVQYLRREQERSRTAPLEYADSFLSVAGSEPGAALEALQRLPQVEQLVVVRTVINDHTDQDVANALGRSRQNIAEIRALALLKLRHLLS